MDILLQAALRDLLQNGQDNDTVNEFFTKHLCDDNTYAEVDMATGTVDIRSDDPIEGALVQQLKFEITLKRLS